MSPEAFPPPQAPEVTERSAYRIQSALGEAFSNLLEHLLGLLGLATLEAQEGIRTLFLKVILLSLGLLLFIIGYIGLLIMAGLLWTSFYPSSLWIFVGSLGITHLLLGALVMILLLCSKNREPFARTRAELLLDLQQMKGPTNSKQTPYSS